MKEQLKRVLKKWPALYSFVATGYARFWYFLSGTSAEERRWAGRTIGEGYWNNIEHPSKHFLVERIAAFSPFSSILEVGCASGPNLYLLAKRFPQAEIVGIDINSEAIDYGNAQFKREGISNVKLSIGKADELGEYQDRSFDIVFTNGLLLCIGPDKIKKVIMDMIRIARKGLILMEWHCFEPESKCNSRDVYVGYWVRDYVALLKEFISEEKIRVIKIPNELWPDENWQKWGGVIEVILD